MVCVGPNVPPTVKGSFCLDDEEPQVHKERFLSFNLEYIYFKKFTDSTSRCDKREFLIETFTFIYYFTLALYAMSLLIKSPTFS